MQHPTLRHLQHDMFASLRRWMKMEEPTQELPLEMAEGRKLTADQATKLAPGALQQAAGG